jgi:TusA-related sulfurtransferase
MNSIAYDVFLDVVHEECPIPTIRTKVVLDTMQSGAVLKVVTERDGAVRNIHTFIKSNAHELIHEDKANDIYALYIRKG